MVTVGSGGSNRVLDLAEAADFLRVPPTRLRGYWKAWGIKAHKVGRELRFLERDLVSYIEQHPA